jgi:hypothetical protein
MASKDEDEETAILKSLKKSKGTNKALEVLPL